MSKRKPSPTQAEIADRDERQRFWSEVMRDDGQAMRDRLRASDLLGRSTGDFVERHEHSQKGPIQLTLNLGGESVDPEKLGW